MDTSRETVDVHVDACGITIMTTFITGKLALAAASRATSSEPVRDLGEQQDARRKMQGLAGRKANFASSHPTFWGESPGWFPTNEEPTTTRNEAVLCAGGAQAVRGL